MVATIGRWLRGVGGLVMLAGGAAFLSFFCGPFVVPDHIEWPVGTSDRAIQMAAGEIVVPVVDRIQVYGVDRKFVRAWRVPAGGAGVGVTEHQPGIISAYSAKYDTRWDYDLRGELLDTVKRSDLADPETDDEIAVTIPTTWWLWPFTRVWHGHVVAAVGWLLAVVGNGGLGRRPARVVR